MAESMDLNFTYRTTQCLLNKSQSIATKGIGVIFCYTKCKAFEAQLKYLLAFGLALGGKNRVQIHRL